MGDKKNLYLIAIVIIILIIIGGSIFLFFYLNQSVTPVSENLPENTNTNTGSLPQNLETNAPLEQSTAGSDAALKKEKQFISSFWQEPDLSYKPASLTYQLPLSNIKEQVTNYRDFSRKIDLEKFLPKLSSNGFVVIASPFSAKPADWESSYLLLKEKPLPLLITADSVISLYQTTIQVIYKEIEEEIFYPSLWQLLKEMFDNVKQRYEVKRQQYGIENDPATEANRLELAYLATALKLLQPSPAQIKESLSSDKKYFSAQEGDEYKVPVPAYLAAEINGELQLITSRNQSAKSPIFLYQKNYQNYSIPQAYRTSEKLKNYYLAITWLNDSLFPLWSQANNCQNCSLDETDHQINFLASLYLTNDLASDQSLKNRWANIYKSISFFKGLEANLTYLDYHQALKDTFGENYNLNEIFSGKQADLKENIAKLQAKINSLTFPALLKGQPETKEKAGLRLLRNYYLLENKILAELAGSNLGNYTGETKTEKDLPFTTCRGEKNYYRCISTGLDLFNLLQNQTAKEILEQTANSHYENYQASLNHFSAEIKNFDQYTWHDNAYLSLLFALKSLDGKTKAGYPAFMANAAWAKKSLNTGLAAWTNFHRDINFEKTSMVKVTGLPAYFSYGYVEPQPEIYHQLLANTKMIIDGFNTLKIISPQNKSYERLTNLKTVLETAAAISKKELENKPLEVTDYNFINDFAYQIKGIIGDIKKENIQNQYVFSYSLAEKKSLNEQLNGLNYLIVAYPGEAGKLFFAIGPILNYNETATGKNTPIPWQNEFKP
ncbi:MAG: DUF3160 domain-containing protein [Patescibacteria group bacterium]|jgi:hypothetical protein